MLKLPVSDPGVPVTGSPGRFLLWCARKQLRTLTTGSVFGIIWMGSQALIPLALGVALTSIIHRDRGAILKWALVVLLLGLVQAAAGILRHRRAVANFLICASRVQQLIARKAVALGGDLAQRVATGEVANLGASDVERVGDALDVIARFAGGIVSYGLVAAILLVRSPPLGAIVVLGVPFAVLVVTPMLRPFERRQTAERDRRTAASSLAADTVSGLRILRGLGGERVFGARYDRASADVASASMKTADFQALLDGSQVLLPGAIVVAVTWVGAHLAIHHSISAGALVAFYASAAFLVIPMQTFVEAAGKWTAAVVASRRILGVLTLVASIGEGAAETTAASASPASSISGPPQREVVVLPTGPIVDQFTGVQIREGHFIAVVPATPEEGSALLDRLGRWDADATTLASDPSHSASPGVSWGGRDVSTLPLGWYRDHVTVLERSPFHLRGRLSQTVEPTPEALEASQATEIVETLPEQLQTELTEGWRSLSGGQRQRLSLAQVLSRDPEILLLDDPTSAVDAHTEAAIAKGIAMLRRGRTTVVVTTSPLMAEQADEVLLLSGSVLATGTHEELMHTDERYEAVVVRGSIS
jgi:ABC-type multidrug transport system fused ATPase/permease subunit